MPLVALPIIIHLINQRRYQTVRWAAMMFLLAANRMSRGYARLRQWLIMALRMAAIAGLVFAVSRPLAGRLAGAGRRRPGRHDDRPARPLAQHAADRARRGGDSKLETGVRQLAETLETLGSARWVLIESTTNKPRELESLDDAADVAGDRAGQCRLGRPAGDAPGGPRLHRRPTRPGRTEIWICSDIRENDWNADSGRWQALRDGVPRAAAGRPVPSARLSRSRPTATCRCG